MLRFVLASLKAWFAAEKAAYPDLPALTELGLHDAAVARRLRASGVVLEQFMPVGPAELGSSTPEAWKAPFRVLVPLATADDASWLEQAWTLLQAHGLQLELVPHATGTDPGCRRASLAACDLVVLPCWQDGTLAALVEASAMARPVMCVDTPEVRELIRHGCDGLLVPAHNAHALRLAVQLLVRQPSFMRELGNRAHRKVVVAYQLVEDLEQTLETYRRLLPLGQGEFL